MFKVLALNVYLARPPLLVGTEERAAAPATLNKCTANKALSFSAKQASLWMLIHSGHAQILVIGSLDLNT